GMHMDEYGELSGYEYGRVIEAMTEQIQSLTVELATVLCDVSRYLPEDEKEDVRSLDPEDFTCRLVNNEWYQLYVENDLEGYDPLMDEDYLDEVSGYLCDEEEDLFYPSFYSRRNLRGVQ
ncbi:MAG: hypothetical protein IJM63_13325, partial [Solobacterium sp.]|nr:hypothetical protein [Solobacterium sp.]